MTLEGGCTTCRTQQQKRESSSTQDTGSQAEPHMQASANSKTVHVLFRVGGTRWPSAQATPARPDRCFGGGGCRESKQRGLKLGSSSVCGRVLVGIFGLALLPLLRFLMQDM